MPALTDQRSEARDALTRRLADEFADVPSEAVRRCVTDVHARMTHLGLDATPDRVERMAREHLLGKVKSEPPSGRSPGGHSDEHTAPPDASPTARRRRDGLSGGDIDG
ncbi:three-helix bundle dimerization domain-containing protein [Actinomadura fibrosa]|uniref:Three-helix bundle dimerization domain-containing protein n=1 Tax=Actinomadura fibrosa TaxID=111802 RepID=A0ABW2XH54_9ACTN|nr:hypothetical protein [Actinomadura fibrosa]